MHCSAFRVDSPNVKYTEEKITSTYEYQSTEVTKPIENIGDWVVRPTTTKYKFETVRKIPKLGVLFVGWGGNNGSTVTAGVLANKHNICWETKAGIKKPNYFGSLTQASVTRIGNIEGQEVYTPLKSLLPMVEPNNIIIGGWDINSANLADAMKRAQVLDYDLQCKLRPLMQDLIPMPGIFDSKFVAANQEQRANNVIPSSLTKKEIIEHIRKDIKKFQTKNKCDKIVVLWTASTERYAEVHSGLNLSKEDLLKSIDSNSSEISPSSLYCLACLEEGVPFINGSPQNTFVPGLQQIAEETQGAVICGDDFKSGQTKFKSVLVDFLVAAGIKPISIVSYNHLGNNDGKNLSAPKCFRSKEISKSDVVNDIVSSNRILYEAFEKPDHCIVIKYIPAVGDSKRAMDEYTSEIFMHGINTIVAHNTCEDSLLAAPLIIDLVILAELLTRIKLSKSSTNHMSPEGDYEPLRCMHPFGVILSYLTKSPLVPTRTPCINSLSRQRAMLENVLKACVGLPPDNNMLLEFK